MSDNRQETFKEQEAEERRVFKEKLYELRKNEGYKTQEEFSKHLGISIDTYKKWEQGKKLPSKKNLKLITDKTGCDPEYFSGKIKEKNRDIQFICETTGLSEDSIQMFVDYKKLDEKRKRYEELRKNPPRRKVKEEHEMTIEAYNDPEYNEAAEIYRIEYNRASDEYRQEVINLNRKYPHIPDHLVNCINKLLDSCREQSERGNIIDLIYQYAFSPLPQDVEVVHHYPGKKGIHRDHKGRIQSSDYLSINVIDEYAIEELLRQNQLNDIISKLSELREESKEKGEKPHGTN